MLDRAKAGKATAQQLFDYYLGWLDRPERSRTHFQLIPDATVAYAKQWGMNVEIEDLHRVVSAAERPAARSCSAATRSAARSPPPTPPGTSTASRAPTGLAGLVFIDGGSAPDADHARRTRTRRSPTSTPARRGWRSAGSPRRSPACSTRGLARRARSTRTRRRSARTSRLLPANLKPPVPVTNAGQYGYALDTETSPPSLAAAQAHLGHLAATGDPRGWDRRGRAHADPALRGRCSPGWGLKGLDGTAWYHPQRLTIDAGAVADGNANPAQEVLDVHATHGARPAASCGSTRSARRSAATRVLDAAQGARRAVAASRPRNLTLVDRHDDLRAQRPELGGAGPQRVPEEPHPVPAQGQGRRLTEEC